MVIALELIGAGDFVEVFAGDFGFDPANGKFDGAFAGETEVGRAVLGLFRILQDRDGGVEAFEERFQRGIVSWLGGSSAFQVALEFGLVFLEGHRTGLYRKSGGARGTN